jgi:hypothetical protein
VIVCLLDESTILHHLVLSCPWYNMLLVLEILQTTIIHH